MTLVLIEPAHWPHAAYRVVCTTRCGGVSRAPFASLNLGDHVGDDPVAVAVNRQRLAEAIDCRRIQWLQQVHGRDCVRATATTFGTVPRADAAWTDEPGLALAVLTADCVPVVFAAPAHGIVGIAHAGWRGLVGGVLESLVSALPVPPADLVAWLGPAIGPADYQVDAALERAILTLPDGQVLAARVLQPDAAPGHFRLDLFELAVALLARLGVPHVASERLGTFRDSRFYSHRRASSPRAGAADGRTGRFATVVWRPVGSA